MLGDLGAEAFKDARQRNSEVVVPTRLAAHLRQNTTASLIMMRLVNFVVMLSLSGASAFLDYKCNQLYIASI